MAVGKSGYFTIPASSGSNYASMRVNWSEEYFIEGNYSIIKVDPQFIANSPYGYYGFTYYPDGYIKVDGVTIKSFDSGSGSNSVRIDRQDTPYSISSAPFSSDHVSHQDNGYKSVSISVDIAGYTRSGGKESGIHCVGSKTVELTPIPRASTIKATDANIGAVSTISVYQNANYTHSIQYQFGSLSGYIDKRGNVSSSESKYTESTIPFTVPTTFYQQIGSAASGICTLTCRTYSGGSQVGSSQTTTFTAYASQSESAPTVSGTITDGNDVTSNLTGGKKLVRYCSTAVCSITATAKNGATITDKSVNGSPFTSENVKIYNVETDTFHFEARDSRGYVGFKDVTVEMVPYVRLTNNATVKRLSADENSAELLLSGNYFNGSFGSSSNALTVQYRINKSGSYENVPSGLIKLSSNSYSGRVVLQNLPYQSYGNVEVIVKDKVSSLPAKKLTVLPSTPIANWEQDLFKFNVQVSTTTIPFGEKFAQKDVLGYAKSLMDEKVGGVPCAQNIQIATGAVVPEKYLYSMGQIITNGIDRASVVLYTQSGVVINVYDNTAQWHGWKEASSGGGGSSEGNGVIEMTAKESTEDAGQNVWTAHLPEGKSYDLIVRNGHTGSPGKSPTVSVSKTGSTATVTVKNADNTTSSVELHDGVDGKDGRPGDAVGADDVINSHVWAEIATVDQTAQTPNHDFQIVSATNPDAGNDIQYGTMTQTHHGSNGIELSILSPSTLPGSQATYNIFKKTPDKFNVLKGKYIIVKRPSGDSDIHHIDKNCIFSSSVDGNKYVVKGDKVERLHVVGAGGILRYVSSSERNAYPDDTEEYKYVGQVGDRDRTFVATFDQTPFDEIKNAHESGKMVICKVSGNSNLFILTSSYGSRFEFSSIRYPFGHDGSTIAAAINYVSVSKTSGWKRLPELTIYKATDSMSDSNDYIPTTKLVKQYVGDQIKNNRFVVYFNGSSPTSYDEISQAVKEKKEIIGRSTNSKVQYQLLETGSTYVFGAFLTGTDAVTFYSWTINNADNTWVPKDPITISEIGTPNGSTDNVFVAKYNQTPYQDMVDAWSSGKLLVLEDPHAVNSSDYLYLSDDYRESGGTPHFTFIGFTRVGSYNSTLNKVNTTVVTAFSGSWSIKEFQLSADVPVATSDKFGGIKADAADVYDTGFVHIDESGHLKYRPGSGDGETPDIFWCDGMSTYDDIKAAKTSGKLPVFHTGNMYSPVCYIDDNRVQFHFISLPRVKVVEIQKNNQKTEYTTNLLTDSWQGLTPEQQLTMRENIGITEGGGTPEVFWCTDSTTYDEANAAYEANKLLMYKKGRTILYCAKRDTEGFVFNATFVGANPTWGSGVTSSNYILGQSGWLPRQDAHTPTIPIPSETDLDKVLQIKQNAQGAYAPEWIALQGGGAPEIFWCTEANTYEEIKAAYDAKKFPVLIHKFSKLVPLHSIDENEAKFETIPIPESVWIIFKKGTPKPTEERYKMIASFYQLLSNDQKNQACTNIGAATKQYVDDMIGSVETLIGGGF